jgi:hypothetical protein
VGRVDDLCREPPAPVAIFARFTPARVAGVAAAGGEGEVVLKLGPGIGTFADGVVKDVGAADEGCDCSEPATADSIPFAALELELEP